MKKCKYPTTLAILAILGTQSSSMEKSEQKLCFSDLPTELKLAPLPLLTIRDLGVFCQVSSEMNSLASDNNLWKSLYEKKMEAPNTAIINWKEHYKYMFALLTVRFGAYWPPEKEIPGCGSIASISVKVNGKTYWSIFREDRMSLKDTVTKKESLSFTRADVFKGLPVTYSISTVYSGIYWHGIKDHDLGTIDSNKFLSPNLLISAIQLELTEGLERGKLTYKTTQ